MAKVICVLYHRINVVQDNVYNLVILAQDFEEQIKYLKENYNIVRFEDDWSRVEQDSIAITFDDGYADNYKYALPILEKYKVPATVFVSTGNLDTNNEFWWDEIGRLLLGDISYPQEFKLEDPLYDYTWETKTYTQRIELTRTLRWLLRMEPDIDRRIKWTKQLRTWSGVSAGGRDENRPLNWNELKKMDSSEWITIGAHTVNHLSLGAMSYHRQKKEITESVETLEKVLNKQIKILSYPFGSSADYNEDTLRICEELQLDKAATTKNASWNLDKSIYEIPRVSIKNGDLEWFKKLISLYLGV